MQLNAFSPIYDYISVIACKNSNFNLPYYQLR